MTENEVSAAISKKINQLGRCLQSLDQTISLEAAIDLHTSKARIYANMLGLVQKIKNKSSPLNAKSALEAFKAVPEIPLECGDKHLEDAQALVKDFLLSLTKKRFEADHHEVGRSIRKNGISYQHTV